jgi:hypothetical protein
MGRDVVFAGEALDGDVLVGVLVAGEHVEGEALAGLVEDALRLLGLLEQVGDLREGGDAGQDARCPAGRRSRRAPSASRGR